MSRDRATDWLDQLEPVLVDKGQFLCTPALTEGYAAFPVADDRLGTADREVLFVVAIQLARLYWCTSDSLDQFERSSYTLLFGQGKPVVHDESQTDSSHFPSTRPYRCGHAAATHTATVADAPPPNVPRRASCLPPVHAT